MLHHGLTGRSDIQPGWTRLSGIPVSCHPARRGRPGYIACVLTSSFSSLAPPVPPSALPRPIRLQPYSSALVCPRCRVPRAPLTLARPAPAGHARAGGSGLVWRGRKPPARRPLLLDARTRPIRPALRRPWPQPRGQPRPSARPPARRDRNLTRRWDPTPRFPLRARGAAGHPAPAHAPPTRATGLTTARRLCGAGSRITRPASGASTRSAARKSSGLRPKEGPAPCPP